MLKRKITNKIENHIKSTNNKMLIVDGARQIGKSYIIRHVGQKMFPNYIEICQAFGQLARDLSVLGKLILLF